MSNEYLKFDETAEALLAKAQRDGAETMWDRRAAQKTQCGFGEAGVCCRICAMGDAQWKNSTRNTINSRLRSLREQQAGTPGCAC